MPSRPRRSSLISLKVDLACTTRKKIWKYSDVCPFEPEWPRIPGTAKAIITILIVMKFCHDDLPSWLLRCRPLWNLLIKTSLLIFNTSSLEVAASVFEPGVFGTFSIWILERLSLPSTWTLLYKIFLTGPVLLSLCIIHFATKTHMNGNARLTDPINLVKFSKFLNISHQPHMIKLP